MKLRGQILFYRLVGSFLLVLFCGIVLNNVLYSHVHITKDASIIVHAHPYDKHENSEGGEKHKHTDCQLLALGNLHVFSLAEMRVNFEVFENKISQFQEYYLDLMVLEIHFNLAERAPPLFT